MGLFYPLQSSKRCVMSDCELDALLDILDEDDDELFDNVEDKDDIPSDNSNAPPSKGRLYVL